MSTLHEAFAAAKADEPGRCSSATCPPGFPSRRRRRRRDPRDGRERRRRRRDRPAVLRPAHGRPDHPGRRRASPCAGHAPRATCWRTGRGRGRHRRPDARHDLLEPASSGTASSAFATDLAAAGGVGRHHARPHARRRPGRGSRPPTRRASTGSSSWRRSSHRRAHRRGRRGITTGFVYAASLMGVTGARSRSSAAGARARRAHARRAPRLPVAVGLGVSTAAQAAEVAAYADGVIVGSAFVRAAARRRGRTPGVAAVGRLAADLAAGVRRARLSRPRRVGRRVTGSGNSGAVRSSDTLDGSDPAVAPPCHR